MAMRNLLYSASMAAVMFSTGAALAQENNPLQNLPEPLPPALAYLEESGVKLTHLGSHGGMEGYLGESATGKLQTFYLTPDGEHVVAGLLFRRGGLNVTGVQIDAMKRRFEGARESMENAGDSVGELKLGDQVEVMDMPQLPDANVSGLSSTSSLVESVSQVDAGQESGASLDELQRQTIDYTSSIDRDAFLNDVESVAWFSVGLDEAPILYMVADPQCPYCHAAWQQLRPKVMNGDINLRVILVDYLTGSRDKSISLLARDEPGRAWLTGEGSVQGMNVQSPPPSDSQEYLDGVSYLNINRDFAAIYEFDATPYLIYDGSDGELRSSRGIPDNLDAFLDFIN